MKPVSPVLPTQKTASAEVVYAANQPQYLPLPAVRTDDGMVTTRWRMDWSDRIRALITGNIYLQVLTFNNPLQPVKVMTREPMP